MNSGSSHILSLTRLLVISMQLTVISGRLLTNALYPLYKNGYWGALWRVYNRLCKLEIHQKQIKPQSSKSPS